jgi:hypothetical protein
VNSAEVATSYIPDGLNFEVEKREKSKVDKKTGNVRIT